MSASKKRARSSDRVFLNVGGEVFQTTISTLTANSEFFSRKFSSEWSSDAEDEIFLEREADTLVPRAALVHALLPDCPRSGRPRRRLARHGTGPEILHRFCCRDRILRCDHQLRARRLHACLPSAAQLKLRVRAHHRSGGLPAAG